MIVIVGGGAAGFFAGLASASQNPDVKVVILEKTLKPLAKVRISGGGRCNVTHSCFDPAQLVQNYPRGKSALRGPFTRFQPLDTIKWFEERGVRLKTEDDGRMFPITDSSQTIIDCLMKEAKRLHVELLCEKGVEAITPKDGGFLLRLSSKDELFASKLVVASGSQRSIFTILETLGHSIVKPVPSLFTFNIADHPFKDIAGVSCPKAQVKVLGLEQTGPLLITHWGFSGPAVLKLSSFGARALHEASYKADVHINWLQDVSFDAKKQALDFAKEDHSKRMIGNECPLPLPKSLWNALLKKSGCDPTQRYAELSKKGQLSILEELHRSQFRLEGQTTYKEEFVTAGGVTLDEVNFKTMESKIVPGLYFAGEVLDIDGITGGFNFQNAWTTGYIAGQSAATC